MPCKHAALAAIYAQQMAEMDAPWELWSVKKHDHWFPLKSHPGWMEEREYRQIQKTININGHEVPEPMREKPDIGAKYWYVDIDELRQWTTWQDDEYDDNRFKNGVCHATKQAAIDHAKALLSFSEIKDQS